MHNALAAAALLVFSLILLFAYDHSTPGFYVEQSEEGPVYDVSDSIVNPAEASVFLNGKILPNEGLSTSLSKIDGIKSEHILEITNVLKYHVDFRFLCAGEDFIVEMDENKELVRSFSYLPDPVTTHKLVRNIDGSLEYELIQLPTEKRFRHITGEIKSTLNQALFDYKVEPPVAATVYGILECIINFRSDSRKGDRFSVFIEERYFNGEKLRGGTVLMASYNGKKTGHRMAYAYTDTDKNSAFNAHYTRKGEALISSSLRLPVDKVHVTSAFGNRIHPVTGIKTFHYGVDYRGAVGDPVYSISNGKIIATGYDNISGNKVTIEHPDKTKTVYYHLHKILVKSGQKVNARQKIATVGQTGRVTGAHLHFGIMDKKGKWINPMNRRMIATQKLEGERYARYIVQMDNIDEMIKNHINNEKMATEFTLINLNGSLPDNCSSAN
jgi:murein DD-endopeptidase MepM/ murein hydrolase activator NlpD